MKIRSLFVLFTVAAVAACASHTAALPPTSSTTLFERATAATPTPQAIITLAEISGGSNKSGLQIAIQVAGGKTKPFLFDSGSQGFWVYDNVIGKNYSSTGVPATNTYGSGIVYKGKVVTTGVVISSNRGALTAKGVPVVIVTSASCLKTKKCPADVTRKNCPRVYASPGPNAGQAGINCLEEGRRLFGTFGVDLQPSVESAKPPSTKTAVIYNLLFALAPYSTTFIIDQTHVQLGPNQSAIAGFTFIPMTPLPSPLPVSLPNGAKGWESRFNLCYTIGTYLAKPYCQRSLFDTGAGDVNFKGGLTVTIPTSAAHCGYAVKNLAFTAFQTIGGKKQTIGAFKTGYTSDWNALTFTSPRPSESPSVNTGLTFFNRDEILFDSVAGRVGLKPLQTPGNIGTSTCS